MSVVISLGCRLNAAESEAIRRLAAGEDDLVVVNSCAVTNEAVRQTRQAIRKARRARPRARLVVTGCAAQIDPHAFAAMPEVDRVVGNYEKGFAESFQTPESVRAEAVEAGSLPAFPEGKGKEGLRQAQAERMSLAPPPAEIRVSDIMAVRETAPHLAAGFAGRSRAFVEVQNGCDHRCTFCIIPYGRGNSRSVPAGQVVEQVRALAGEGLGEVVLTGVDLTSYGPDLPGAPTLGLLVERILRYVPELKRLRLSSLDCIEIDERLERVIADEPRFMPHLHLSFQSGDDLILKRMKRRHSRCQAVATVARLKSKRPDLAIGADLIAGFPTETEAMHENSLRLIEECDIVMGHIFPFSPRRGTPAARMPQLPPKVVRERAARLREACERRRRAWLDSLVGTRQQVLVEKDGFGHAENFAPVQLRHPRKSGDPDSTAAPASRFRGNDGGVVAVRIEAVEDDRLVGTPA